MHSGACESWAEDAEVGVASERPEEWSLAVTVNGPRAMEPEDAA